jgi:hypothetical protein
MTSKRWWVKGLLTIPNGICADLDLMCQNISVDPDDSNWKRYIGYIIDRSPNCEAIQDAAHEGLGGWSSTFLFMWRITHDELRSEPISWPMKAFDDARLDAPINAKGLHINILEFLALIINLWFVLWAIHHRAIPPGGWILSLRTDNTSALSWLQHSARTKNPIVKLRAATPKRCSTEPPPFSTGQVLACTLDPALESTARANPKKDPRSQEYRKALVPAKRWLSSKEDFVYFDDAGHLVSHTTLLAEPDRAATFRVTFRYDKSATNHSVRKYTRATNSFLCPIARSLSILQQAHALGVPSGYPRLRHLHFPRRKRHPTRYAHCLQSSIPRRHPLHAPQHKPSRITFQPRHSGRRLASRRHIHRRHRLSAPMESRISGNISARMLSSHWRYHAKSNSRSRQSSSSRSVIVHQQDSFHTKNCFLFSFVCFAVSISLLLFFFCLFGGSPAGVALFFAGPESKSLDPGPFAILFVDWLGLQPNNQPPRDRSNQSDEQKRRRDGEQSARLIVRNSDGRQGDMVWQSSVSTDANANA